MKVAVIGLGKAGLPLAGVMVEAGLEVVGVDLDKAKVEKINSGENPIPEEPELPEIIKEYGGKTLIATTNYEDASDCNAFVIIVPLFIDEKHEADFSILEQAFKSVGKVFLQNSI